jgi:hypothetical protein
LETTQLRGDPADGAKDADERKLLLGIGDVVEGERVGQAEGRHVAEHVKREHSDERPVFAGLCWAATVGAARSAGAAEDVHGGENTFGSEEAVGEHAEEERRDDGGDGADRVSPRDAVGHALAPM